MSAHRFRLDIGGQQLVGLMFASDTELEAFLADHRLVIPAPDPQPDRPDPKRGRPSFATLIETALQTVDLDAGTSSASRARAVLRHLAATHEELPSLRTVRGFLASRPVGGKAGQKAGRNSARVKIVGNGGL